MKVKRAFLFGNSKEFSALNVENLELGIKQVGNFGLGKGVFAIVVEQEFVDRVLVGDRRCRLGL